MFDIIYFDDENKGICIYPKNRENIVWWSFAFDIQVVNELISLANTKSSIIAWKSHAESLKNTN